MKKRLILPSSANYPRDAPHLFVQNNKVNKFNNEVHIALSGQKYFIKAQDGVISAQSLEFKNRILKQIPSDPKKTKQLHSILRLAVGERTKISQH